MKPIFIIIIIIMCVCASLRAQSTEEGPEQDEQLENLVEKTDAGVEDDSDWQRLNEWRKNPVDLNSIEEDDLKSLGFLTDLQIKNFFRYRELLGKLIAVHELQAIPSWNLETIMQILPFIKVGVGESFPEALGKRWRGGNNYLLFRISQALEKSKEYDTHLDSSGAHYLGNPQHILFRYTYNYKNMFQYGILGDKDAGEQFFRGHQRYGFDFYSFHFFVRKIGIVRSLALGDFTVNLGQGLIQWQSLAFTKSATVLAIKRQSPVLRPYHASGEFNFHRGVGITLQKGSLQATIFASAKRISANLAADTIDRQDAISSFENSGYHRTINENEDRNNIKQISAGFNVDFSDHNRHLGVNAIHYYFSKPIQKQNQPYNLFAIQGRSWFDYSADYSYTYRNLHFFGEAAIDKNSCVAFVNGALISLSSTVDAAILYRNIDKGYQSLYADAFTENTVPGNEKGFYAGLSVRPFAGWRIDAFFDTYMFPWLKFRVDAPSYGRDFFVKLFYQPNKKWYIYTCFKNDAKQANFSGTGGATHLLALVPRQDWRTEITVSIDNKLSLKNRLECVWYNRNGADAEQGFLNHTDITFQPPRKLYNGNLGLQYFETSGYNSRIYVSERDVLYSFSLPVCYDKGFRYYIKVSSKLNRLFHVSRAVKPQLEMWLRWTQTVYTGRISVNTGQDSVNGNTKSELKLQLMLSW